MLMTNLGKDRHCDNLALHRSGRWCVSPFSSRLRFDFSHDRRQPDSSTTAASVQHGAATASRAGFALPIGAVGDADGAKAEEKSECQIGKS